MKKYNDLIKNLRQYEQLIVAFSGGVDSTFLMFAAQVALGKDSLAITVNSEFFPKWELMFARELALKLQFSHKVITFRPFENSAITDNTPKRCYLCKKEITQIIKEYTKSEGVATFAEASNVDDFDDYRPGMQAITEAGYISPLVECEFSKNEIRDASKKLGIPGWDRPACACLASRIPYYEVITKEALIMIEKSEEYLHNLGFDEVRVRKHGDCGRIEVAEKNLEKIFALKNIISGVLHEYGFKHISLDIDGYQKGSLNKSLDG